MSSVFGVSVAGATTSIFSTKEKAEKMVALLEEQQSQSNIPIPLNMSVHEIYLDCFINKLENGYKVYKVKLSKSGKLLRDIQEVNQFPKLVGGYRYSSITPIYTSTGLGPTGIGFVYQNLHSSPNEALQEAQAARQKTLLDDYWEVCCKKWGLKELP